MRILSATIGAVLGAIAGLVLTFFTTVLIWKHEMFVAMFMGLIAAKPALIFGGIAGLIIGVRLLPYLRDSETGRIRAKKSFGILGSALAALIVLTSAVFLIVRSEAKPPSDQKLIANFNRHEATFSKLVEMVKTDRGLVKVDADETNPKNPETVGI